MKRDQKTVAIVWRGDAEVRRTVTPENNRFHHVFEELQALGIRAIPVVFDEEVADAVREQLLGCDGALVWVNPLQGGKTRKVLNQILEEVAAKGIWASAHPDAIRKLGTKEVLFQTKHLGWGSDTKLYKSYAALRDEFPKVLASSGSRVLKQARGNDGQGVWKIELKSPALRQVRLMEASREGVAEDTSLDDFLKRCEPYFEQNGFMVDQPFQERLAEGMVRCYVAADQVVGFAHQYPKGLLPPGYKRPHAEKLMYAATEPRFAALRQKMNSEWVPQLMEVLQMDRRSMPVIWDADFLYGSRRDSGEESYVLCEINVSSVFAYPDDAPRAIAHLAAERLQLRKFA